MLTTERMGVRALARLLGKAPCVVSKRRKEKRPSVTEYEAAWLFIQHGIPLKESRPDIAWPKRKR